MELVGEQPDYGLPAEEAPVIADDTSKARRKGSKSNKPKRGARKKRRNRAEDAAGKEEANADSAITDVPGALAYLYHDPKRMVVYTPGFLFEGAGLDDDELREMPQRDGMLVDELWDLEDRDNDYAWYKLHFVGKPHLNFLGRAVPSVGGGPMAVSVIRTGDFYTALVRTVKGSVRRDVRWDGTQSSAFEKLFRRNPSPKSILRAVCPELHDAGELRLCEDPNVPELLLTLHDRQRVTGFKFGLLYAARHQVKEADFYSNTKPSDMFEEFCQFLGDRIELDGWEGFRGGLDVRTGSTGKYALHTVFNPGACRIIFHVSTHLPFDPHNEQQLERKRHIGNDLVVLVFQDSSEAPFRPAELSSRMIHAVLVVRPVKFADKPDETYYRLAVVTKQDTPRFAPALDNYAIYKKSKAFRELLFHKLLNGERAAYLAPTLSGKMTKTRGVLLSDVMRHIAE